MDKQVKVRDRVFGSFHQRSHHQRTRGSRSKKINSDLEGEKPLFLAVLNGSFVFAADLMREITTPCEITFVRLSSYSGTSTTGQVKQLIGLNESLEGRTVVIVEDIIDSGLTMKELLHTLSAYKPKDIRIASLLVKPGNLKVDLDINYRCFDIPNDFIVGYGLDYDGEGRNLPDIYTVVD